MKLFFYFFILLILVVDLLRLAEEPRISIDVIAVQIKKMYITWFVIVDMVMLWKDKVLIVYNNSRWWSSTSYVMPCSGILARVHVSALSWHMISSVVEMYHAQCFQFIYLCHSIYFLQVCTMRARIEDGVVYSPYPGFEVPSCSLYTFVKRHLACSPEKLALVRAS